MEFNYIAVFCLYLTSFLVIKHASCSSGKFLLPDDVSLFALPPVLDVGSTITSSIFDFDEASSPTASSPSASSPETSITSLIADITSTNLIDVPKKVVDACKNTDHPNECSNSVAPLLKENENLGPVSILQGETKAFDHALEVAKEDIGGEEDDNAQAISTCKQMYENAREEISKAMELASKNDKYGVNIYLSAALTYIDTCKDEIPKDMKEDSKIVQTNKLLEELASNTLALGNNALGLDNEEN
ncbi:uncharacterized protein LOC141652891 [Silene latifolia]|uniref:uncharacterized protein LOC141652891 n=1 Tax=Silene latifolia TaxID=37657 RepID=UPI003D76AB33